MKNLSDVMIHLDEPLSQTHRNTLEERMRALPGVIAVRFNPGKNHLLLIAFDPDQVRPIALLAQAKSIGYTAQLVGA